MRTHLSTLSNQKTLEQIGTEVVDHGAITVESCSRQRENF